MSIESNEDADVVNAVLRAANKLAQAVYAAQHNPGALISTGMSARDFDIEYDLLVQHFDKKKNKSNTLKRELKALGDES